MTIEALAAEYGQTIQALARREALLRRRLAQGEGDDETLLRRQTTLQEELRDLRRIQAHLLQYVPKEARHA